MKRILLATAIATAGLSFLPTIVTTAQAQVVDREVYNAGGVARSQTIRRGNVTFTRRVVHGRFGRTCFSEQRTVNGPYGPRTQIRRRCN